MLPFTFQVTLMPFFKSFLLYSGFSNSFELICNPPQQLRRVKAEEIKNVACLIRDDQFSKDVRTEK